VLMMLIMLLEAAYLRLVQEKSRTLTDIIDVLLTTGASVFGAFIEGAKRAIQVAIACACAGIIVGTVTMTGLGLKLSGYIELFSGGVLFYGLLLAMIASLVLGIGLPTTAKYIVLATLVAPGPDAHGRQFGHRRAPLHPVLRHRCGYHAAGFFDRLRHRRAGGRGAFESQH